MLEELAKPLPITIITVLEKTNANERALQPILDLEYQLWLIKNNLEN